MTFKYNLVRVEKSPTATIIDIIKEANSPTLPEGIISKLENLFDEINTSTPSDYDEVLVPVLSPFLEKHDKTKLFQEKSTDITQIPEPLKQKERTLPTVKENPKIKTMGNVQYRTYPYVFSRPGETIEAVTRLYNDMSISRAVLDKLVQEFSLINKDSLPPKLGQTVQIPVLLPFCFRHENDNKIFTDEK